MLCGSCRAAQQGDKVTIVSRRNGDAAGALQADRRTSPGLPASCPRFFEALSGMQISDLLSKVPV